MKSTAFLIVFLLTVSIVSAHEHQVFKIGDKFYMLTVGSLNEPVFVDDKTGVEFEVLEMDITDASIMAEAVEDEDSAIPVEGLEETLKVEISAGGKSKVLDLDPAWGSPGAYEASFYPTVQTTYTYRFFGTIDGVDVDLSFACNPLGGEEAVEDASVSQVSDGVSRYYKKGAFGCPRAKADAGFPEASTSLLDIQNKPMQNMQEDSSASPGSIIAYIALILSVVALILAFKRK